MNVYVYKSMTSTSPRYLAIATFSPAHPPHYHYFFIVRPIYPVASLTCFKWFLSTLFRHP